MPDNEPDLQRLVDTVRELCRRAIDYARQHRRPQLADACRRALAVLDRGDAEAEAAAMGIALGVQIGFHARGRARYRLMPTTEKWFAAGRAIARRQDRKRHRGPGGKVPLTIVAKVEADGLYKGSKLAAQVACLSRVRSVRGGYRALVRWREFKASGLVFLVELDEQGPLVVTTDEPDGGPLTR